MDPVIQLDKVKFAWQDKAVLNIEHWQVEKGQKVFLYGPSGSGKSTLLNLLCGILTPQEGSIRVLSQELSSIRAGARDRFRARHIGVIFQQFNLLPYLSVRQNILLAAHFGRTESVEPDHLQQITDQLQLNSAMLERKAGELSVGQQQRVAVARALFNHPEIIIADEPTSALDSELRDQFVDLLLQCCDRNQASVVFVSHDKSLAGHFDQQQSLSELNCVTKEQVC
ncbi:ABC transporter ATP-binding protein [Lacimicrobium alkaliphilum]|uniref:ABC transporter ATP-binding protein n=1 Tax=Lacimicrobium alkaliphilum TaxID=1526571 RepID=A0ABQ1RAL4_9ALTE|nr:ABC transporter ATP-binding protein [Lacimicrobium alkaliphilum]GGD64085.1 ABC transporter ATP-binding protein [Lacimicrobium alkaliphilum]